MQRHAEVSRKRLLAGQIELLGIVVYLIPPTSVLGAILLAGYSGGAVATHLRVGSPLFTHTCSRSMWAR
jgi:hypothetical protein